MNSIAIIGASRDRRKFGNKALRAYKEQGWVVYPVNPKETEVEGMHCFASVSDIPIPVDVASLYVPPAVGIRLVQELSAKGIKKVFLNPGSESPELLHALADKGMEVIMACSIRAIGAISFL